MSDETVLRLEAIERRYGRGETTIEVLNGVELSLRAGESVALIAPSGAGKSTLLHIAGLLERPDAGEVHVGGHATSTMNDESRTALRRSEIGFVYQFHHLLPEFSALENVVLPQMIAGLKRGEAAARAHELLGFLGLGARESHRPAELSGGEQQRVALARALANAPRVLLADEPTGNLDPTTSVGIMRLLDRINRTGTTVLMATHDSEVVDSMRRRVVELDSGKLVRDQVRGVYGYAK